MLLFWYWNLHVGDKVNRVVVDISLLRALRDDTENGSVADYSDTGIPIPKTLVIWVSPVTLNQITKVIWEGDVYITKVWEWGCPKRGDAHITVLNIRLKEEKRRDFTKSTTDS